MASSVPADVIDAQAARWAARALYGEMPAAFDAWLAADRRHRGAYLRARAGLYAIEDAVADSAGVAAAPAPAPVQAGNDDEAPARPRWRIPRPLLFGGALAASLAALVGLGLPMIGSLQPAREASDLRLTLADGSVATLGEDARIAYALRDGVRSVALIQGEAVFHVAKDRAHPFVVRSGDVYAQATGTVYSVRRVGGTGGAVRVSEGSVLVWARDERDQAVLFHAGDAVTLEPGTRQPAPPALAKPAPPPSPPPALAQIALDNVTIETAARRFNRINRTRIEIADPAVGQMRIVGLFRADDPEQFARAAAAVARAEVEISGDGSFIKLK
ncbi:transmembrane sensor [Sphingomonas zeicaulis]|uniref:FecR family protein n=1 Tax=Sphingomonas zeicaulis TaxID=1632740 RepID=UPI003D212638